MTTIVSLAIDPESQARFDALRRQHYPAALNQIAAHITLFHTLPGTGAVRGSLLQAAEAQRGFGLQVAGLRSLGRGVAYTLESSELMLLHRDLANAFADHLTPQDRQKFQPHIVVQNKVAAAEARSLLAELQSSFASFPVRAEGLLWWEYLGGPWRLIERFPFAVS